MTGSDQEANPNNGHMPIAEIEERGEWTSHTTVTQTARGITFSAKGDTEQGLRLGFMLGRCEMHETIFRGLREHGLLTKELREYMRSVETMCIEEMGEEKAREYLAALEEVKRKAKN